MIVVADVSAVASFLLPDEARRFAAFARSICLSESLILPPHWRSEMANVLWKAKRRGRITGKQAHLLAAQADAIASDATLASQESTADLLAVALTSGLTSYDAAYLMLAKRTGAALLSADIDLCACSRAEEVTVLLP